MPAGRRHRARALRRGSRTSDMTKRDLPETRELGATSGWLAVSIITLLDWSAAHISSWQHFGQLRRKTIQVVSG